MRSGPKPSEERISRTGIGYALLSALCFSTLGIFATSLFDRGYSVAQTLAWRFVTAAVFLWVAIGVRKLLGKTMGVKIRATLPGLLVLALIGFTPQSGLFFVTVKMLAPGITSLLLYLYPAFVLLLTALFWRKKPTKGQLAALAMSLLGCLLTFYKPGAYPILGLALGVLVAFAYGVYLVVSEKMLAGIDPLFSTAVIMTVAGTVYLGLLAATGTPWKTPSSAVDCLYIAGIALFATVLPITALFSAMSRVGAANTSLISTIEPVSTVFLSVIFLGEKLTLNRIWGGIFIVGGVVALRFFSRPRPSKESKGN